MENVVLGEFSMCKKHFFPDDTAFFCVFDPRDFHHFSPFSLSTLLFTSLSHLLSTSSSPPLHLLSTSSPLLSSPWSSVVSVVVVSSLSCVVVVSFFSVLRHCCCCTVAAASAVAARAAGGSCVFLSGYFSFRFDFSFCLFSLSFRPLLSSCQVHSARRVACT